MRTMQNANAMAKSPTTYTVRPNAYPGHWDVSFAREDGSHGYTGCAPSLRGAVDMARGLASAEDKLFARKSLYRGSNKGAWHRLAVA